MTTDVRDLAMTALLAHVQAQCGTLFKTYSRRFVMWDDLVNMLAQNAPQGTGLPPDFPALFVYDGIGFGGGVNTWRQTGDAKPPVRTFTVTLVAYARKTNAGTPEGADNQQIGMTILTPLVAAVEAAFQYVDAPSFGTLTLGGLVRRAWLEGDGHSVPGDIDPSGLAMQTFPVKIMLP